MNLPPNSGLLPPKTPPLDISFDSMSSPEQNLDKIMQKTIQYTEKQQPSQTIFNISKNISLSTVNDYEPESESISECDLDLHPEDPNLNESNKGIEPLMERSCFLSRIWFFNYFIYLFDLSFNVIRKKKMISFKDLQFLTEEQKIEKDLHRFLEQFNKTVEENNGNITEWQFMWILFSIFKKRLFLAWLFWTMNTCICFVFALFIDKLLEIHEENWYDRKIYYWAIALSVGFFLQYMTGSRGWYLVCEFNTKFRLLMINSLYLKIMKLNNFSIQKANIGKIINIIANDMNTVEFKFVYLIFLLTTPLTLVLSLFLMWRKLGPLCLIAIPILGIIYYIQRWLSSTNVKNIREKNVYSDQRMKFCNELIEGIKLLKFYAWETTVKRFIDDIRDREINALKKYSQYVYADRSLSVNSSFITCLILFYVYNNINTTNYLGPSLVFSIYQLMEYIRTYQISYVGFGLSFFFEFRVILRRIIDILNLKETHQIDYLQDLDPVKETKSVLKINDFTAYWDTAANSKPVLKNISMNIENRKTYAIIGKIGSGKSSLIYSILREIPKATGSIQFRGSLAYVEQEPFIVHGTVRSNILFFKDFNEQLYRKVLRVSCLEKDLVEFPNKDLTEIGERGVNLSGGQKARISLARALYSQADIYLLDDPLSALDAKVGRRVFELAIKKFLKKKTVILVTHQIQFLSDVDHIFLLDEGTLKKEGNFMSFKQDLDHYFENKPSSETESPIEEEKKNEDMLVFERNPPKKLKKLYENQEDAEAQVSLMTYFQFVKYSNSLWLGLACILLFILFEGSKYCTSFLYSFFGHDDNQPEITDNDVFIAIFVLVFVQLTISFLKYFCFVKLVLTSNKNIHKKMTEGVVRAPSIFFDTHHSGSILNRFSNDIGLMDGLLILTMIDFFDLSLTFITGIIISGSINLWFFIPGGIILVLLYKVFVLAKPVILDLKKLDLQNKSPIFGFFSSTLTGLSSINVYKKNQNFIQLYSQLIENSARCNNNFWEVSRGFGFAVENLSKLTSIIGLFITLHLNSDYTGLLGQQIIYLLLISETLQWGLRQAINADSVMSSTLRALKFTELFPEDLLYKPKDRELVNTNQWIQSVRHENEEVHILTAPQQTLPTGIALNELKGQWPSRGEIEFCKVSLRYREDLDLTLHDLTFKILPGEKIGVVGRTGAGKSSIIQALFRMVDICQGKIMIDGVNVKEIGLHTLRGNMSIIPQNPFVFMGSVRRNIDPMGLNSDDEIRNALENVELKEHIEGLAKGIDADMSYAKSVFSVGQKQLLCLARTILKKNKILVLDEATANVDLNTDILIQKKIKELFKSCTILTVAHRLLTIADYDRVMVLERGRLVEFDEPFLLLTSEEKKFEISKKGYFADMVRSMGLETSKKLLETTRNYYYSKRNVNKN